MKKKFFFCSMVVILAFAVFIPASTLAASATLVDNRVIVDNAPFYSVGSEDELGGYNYALNSSGFIDIPYVIFDFGSTTSVSSAMFNWNFIDLYGGSDPAEITLYAGNDTSGTISVDDRFMGTAVDTFTYSGGEIRNFDLTSLVNLALLNGQYFALRLEATASPDTLSGYYGGQFATPSMTYAPVPVPGAIWLFGSGLFSLVGLKKHRKSKIR
jgi:hypothetical protein